METCCSNIGSEALVIHHGLEKFHHYYFSCEVSVTTKHQPLVEIFIKNIASLSHKCQRILLQIHQYNIRILCKQGQNRCQRILLQIHQHNIRILCKQEKQFFFADWLYRHNHETNRDEDIPSMCITISAIESCMNLPECMAVKKIRIVTIDDEHLGVLLELVLHGWLSTKAEV